MNRSERLSAGKLRTPSLPDLQDNIVNGRHPVAQYLDTTYYSYSSGCVFVIIPAHLGLGRSSGTCIFILL